MQLGTARQLPPVNLHLAADPLAVVPAKAGTHTLQQGDVAGPAITETLVVMGPRPRGDDSGEAGDDSGGGGDGAEDDKTRLHLARRRHPWPCLQRTNALGE